MHKSVLVNVWNAIKTDNIFPIFTSYLGLFLVVSSSKEVATFIPGTVKTSYDKMSCHDRHFYI